MSLTSEFLPPRRIHLSVAATDKAAAIEEVLGLLSGDPCVRDFDALRQAILGHEAPVISEDGCALIIAHGRTESAARLVVAAGRCVTPFLVPESKDPVSLVFVAGIPAAFNANYLRIIGSIARICKNPETRSQLLSAPNPTQFSEIIEGAGKKL